MTQLVFSDLSGAADRYRAWLADAALPLWADLGVESMSGAFREGVWLSGEPYAPFRRARVQARQAYAFAAAHRAGFEGPWLEVARRGFAAFRRDHRRPDGLFVNTVEIDGSVRDPACGLYEQAFVLFALAELARAGEACEADALALLAALAVYRHPAGGFREVGAVPPFQANAQMHLLESCLAWEALGGDAEWGRLADEIAEFALRRFVDLEAGLLQEFYDAEWLPRAGEAGLHEPGHHFEWAWLLERWGRARGHGAARTAAQRLFATGRRGLDPARGLVVNSLWPDLSVRDGSARLWPQTEYLKAALILGRDDDALAAAHALATFLAVDLQGAWRDKFRPDGVPVDEPAPASSFYHIVLALLELFDAVSGTR